MKYLKLDYGKIAKEYPCVVRDIREWYISLPNMNWELIKEGGEKEGLVDSMVALVIQHDPRKLYDYFDYRYCRIFITDHEDNRDDNGDLIFYCYNSISRVSKSGRSRVDVETIAFMDAFDTLEAAFELDLDDSKE